MKMNKPMKLTWVTRSFLDYRIPVYQAIDDLCGHNLTLIFNGEVVPEHLIVKMKQILGDRCIPLKGEIRLIGKKRQPVSISKSKSIRIPIQRGLISAIRKSQPDVIISDGFFQWTYAPLIIKMFNRKIKHVMCYEGWSHTERNMQSFRIKYRKIAMKFIDEICCNGSLCSAYVKSLGFSSKHLHIGNMAADVSFFMSECSKISFEQIEEFKKQHTILGTTYIFSGRLVELKGVRELLKAWSVFSKGKDVCLVLVGDGPLKDEISIYCESHSLSNVRILGKVEYAKLPLYYKSADCFIIPTLQDNWSLVVPEAMACGLPIISSVYNGCWPELVRKENGWTFDPLQIESFVNVLNDSYCNRNKFIEMGNTSCEIIHNFTPSIVAKNIYDACLKAKK